MSVVQESAGREKTLVSQQLAHDFRGARRVAIVDVVDGAHVVHAAAGDEVASLGESHGHYPGGAQRYYLDFVGRPRVPDDELAVQRARHAVPENNSRKTAGLNFYTCVFSCFIF